MCTGIVENTKLSGSGKGRNGWGPIDQASVSYDHPEHIGTDHAVIIDFLNRAVGPDSRIAVELTAESARQLAKAIERSLSRGESSRAESKVVAAK